MNLYKILITLCIILFMIFLIDQIYLEYKRSQLIPYDGPSWINKDYDMDNIIMRPRHIYSDTCNHLIQISNKYIFDKDDDPVDGDPEYQIDIYTKQEGILNQELWENIQFIYLNKILPELNSKKWINDIEYYLDFVFLKRYRPDERTHLGLHIDDDYLSATIMLSDSSEYENGRFYLFPKEFSRKHEYVVSRMSTEERDAFISSHDKLPIVNQEQGDTIIYTGSDHLHGTLPITSGSRYVLIFFFDRK